MNLKRLQIRMRDPISILGSLSSAERRRLVARAKDVNEDVGGNKGETMKFVYRVKKVTDGYCVCADGYVTRSLPHGTKGDAEAAIRVLVRKNPGSIYLD